MTDRAEAGKSAARAAEMRLLDEIARGDETHVIRPRPGETRAEMLNRAFGNFRPEHFREQTEE